VVFGLSEGAPGMQHVFLFPAENADKAEFERKSSRCRLLTHRRLQASRSADQAPGDVWQQWTVGGASMPVIAS
jgi:hypothetical protein